jgi:hypothetical protein
MAKQLLQLNFKFGMARDEYETMANELAGAFANGRHLHVRQQVLPR